MDVEDDHPPEEGVDEARQPTLTGLVSLCRELNDRNALHGQSSRNPHINPNCRFSQALQKRIG